MRLDEIGPLRFFRRFTDEWLVSRQAATLFLVSVPFILALTPFLLGWVTVTNPTIWMNVLGAIIGVAGPIALFFLWLGMWRYWMRLDDSTVVAKRIWFAVLLVGLCYGSILYFFLVYRPQLIARAKSET